MRPSPEGHNVRLGINWDLGTDASQADHSAEMDEELPAGESFSLGTCAYTGMLMPSSLTCCH